MPAFRRLPFPSVLLCPGVVVRTANASAASCLEQPLRQPAYNTWSRLLSHFFIPFAALHPTFTTAADSGAHRCLLSLPLTSSAAYYLRRSLHPAGQVRPGQPFTLANMSGMLAGRGPFMQRPPNMAGGTMRPMPGPGAQQLAQQLQQQQAGGAARGAMPPPPAPGAQQQMLKRTYDGLIKSESCWCTPVFVFAMHIISIRFSCVGRCLLLPAACGRRTAQQQRPVIGVLNYNTLCRALPVRCAARRSHSRRLPHTYWLGFAYFAFCPLSSQSFVRDTVLCARSCRRPAAIGHKP